MVAVTASGKDRQGRHCRRGQQGIDQAYIAGARSQTVAAEKLVFAGTG